MDIQLSKRSNRKQASLFIALLVTTALSACEMTVIEEAKESTEASEAEKGKGKEKAEKDKSDKDKDKDNAKVTCDPGQYVSSGVCVDAGVGYYSLGGEEATRSACANKPVNAAYTSANAKSAGCQFECSAGFVLDGGGCTSRGTCVTNFSNTGLNCVGSSGATTKSCNAGEVMVGVQGGAGDILDRVGPICAAVSGNTVSTTTRVATAPNMNGSGGGGGAFSFTCPAGQAVVGINGQNTSYYGHAVTGKIQVVCANYPTGAAGSTSSYYAAAVGSVVSTFALSCSTGQFATGMNSSPPTVTYAGYTNYLACK